MAIEQLKEGPAPADGGGRNPFGTSTGGLGGSTFLPRIGSVTRRPGGYVPPVLPPEDDKISAEDEQRHAERQTAYELKKSLFEKSFRGWWHSVVDEARRTRESDDNTDHASAKVNAAKVIGSTDMSVLAGEGPQFVLEFTALIVIIFSTVILGVLDILKEQQIATLLAAIAGYVLGKATAGPRRHRRGK